MQKIISWNVASVRARLPALMKFLTAESPDILFLQEIKATEETFPFFDLKLTGYSAVISGQKSYNGVAVLSREPLRAVQPFLPNFADQARFIRGETADGTVLISVYVPNGTPPEKDPTDTSRLDYKLHWFSALTDHVRELRAKGRSVIVGGDFNVIEHDTDVYRPDLFRGGALMNPPVQRAFEQFQDIPMINMIRRFHPNPQTYSFWDFQGGAWPRNHGILLDAILVSPDLSKRVTAARIYREVRGWKGTSDHAPVGIDLSD